MSFTPNGTIRLLAGVPLDNTYTHTVRYADRAAQTVAFMAKGKAEWTFEHCTYIREHRSIKVPICADDVIMCNYLMYQNLNYGLDKWFYAFITKVIYINDHNTEIEFEIDVMQTWMYDFSFRPCMIERNHIAREEGNALDTPEPVDIGDYIAFDGAELVGGTGDWEVIMWSSFNPNNVNQCAGGDISTGLYSALDRTVIGRVTMNTFNGANWTQDPRNVIRTLVQNHADKIDGCVAITMSPVIVGLDSQGRYPLTFRASNIDGYTPKNKKLFMSPYNVIALTSGDNNIIYLKPQYFTQRLNDGDLIYFQITTDKAPNETIIAVPLNYRVNGYYYDMYKTLDYIALSGFPQCAWVSDSFKSFLAQNAGSLALGTAIATVSEQPEMLLAEGVRLFDASSRGSVNHGQITGTALMSICGKGIKAFNMCIRSDYAKRIDDFFSMYGYAINEIGVPNIDSRPYWNYIKTKDCLIVPDGINGFPSTDMKLIETIHNNGITYWKTMDNVGNYTLNNAPV